VWNLGQGAPPSLPLESHEGAVTSASFSPDGGRIVTGMASGKARVWSRSETGAWRSGALEGHRDAVTSASFSPDGRRVLTSSKDGTARVWSLGDDSAWHSIRLKVRAGWTVDSATFSPDGLLILTTSHGDSFGGDAELWRQGMSGGWANVALGHDMPAWASFS